MVQNQQIIVILTLNLDINVNVNPFWILRKVWGVGFRSHCGLGGFPHEQMAFPKTFQDGFWIYDLRLSSRFAKVACPIGHTADCRLQEVH